MRISPTCEENEVAMSASPAISIILPTCNRSELLRIALKSLTWQTFRNFEVIVVNDGETDIAPVITEFASRLPIRAVVHSTPRKGISAARNTGIRLSKGDWLVYLDDDDFLYADHLETLYAAVMSSQFQVAYTDALLASQEEIDGVYQTVGRELPVSLDFDPAVLAWRNLTPTHTLIHAKSCLLRCQPFAPYLHGHEDWDLWQRLGRHYRFAHLNDITAEYIRRKDAKSLSANKEVMSEGWLFVRRQGLLHSTLPSVFSLEEHLPQAVRIGPSSGPCRISVILPLGQSSAFLASPSAMKAFDALCRTLGEAQLILAGSGDNMPELYLRAAAQLQRRPKYFCTPRDVGRVFTANQAAVMADGEWLVFLEPGIEPCSGWLEALLDAGQTHPAAGALGGIVEAPRMGRFAGGRFNTKSELIFNRLNPQTMGGEPFSLDCLSGLCLMLRRERFIALDGFSPAFAPGHYADADLCLRLKQQRLDILAVPAARLLWNQAGAPLRQSPAGLVSRRAFWDSWLADPFVLSSLISGSEWSMRPEDLSGLWSSDGIMPPSFDISLPSQLR